MVQFLTNRGTQLVMLGVDYSGRNWYIPGQDGGQRYTVLQVVVDSFELDTVLVTEGSILGPCYEIWE
jgi:hypothetical protein